LSKKGFNDDQLEVLKTALINGLDIKDLLNKNLSAKQMDVLKTALLNRLDIKDIADPVFSLRTMKLIISERMNKKHMEEYEGKKIFPLKFINKLKYILFRR